MGPPAGLDRCWALLSYEGPTRELLARIKYRNERGAYPVLGRALAMIVLDWAQALCPSAPTITFAPTTGRRVRTRGYDQAELLARGTSRAAGVPLARLLSRSPGPAQTGRDRAHRLDGPFFQPRCRVPPMVIVMDDVWTTGATLSAAAHALRGGGAEQVFGLVLAARP